MNKKKQKLVPQLRFPEFEGDDDWKKTTLGYVCLHFKGFAFKSKDYTANGRRVVRVSDMGFDYIKNETNAIYIKEDKAKLYEKWKLMKDDLIITTVGSKPPVYNSLVGRTIVVKSKDKNSLLNQNSVCLRANKNIKQGFLNTLFKRKEYISFIESIIRGNANQGSIALVDLFKYKILQPKPKEQQKIADCLSSLDNVIGAENEKLANLKEHKKGLLQHLFPAEGETVPQFRFPEFVGDGDWEEKELNTIANRTIQKNENEKINVVFTNSAIDGIVDQREYFDKDIADKNNLGNYYIVKTGDYVYNPRISNFAPVGPISKNKTGKTGVMSPLYTVFSFMHYNDSFYEYYFQTVHWYNSIRKISNTGARYDRMSITTSNFMKIPVLNPHPKEQQKIANCLSSLDNLIASQTKKIAALKAHKKGLMQQLFPNSQ